MSFRYTPPHPRDRRRVNPDCDVHTWEHVGQRNSITFILLCISVSFLYLPLLPSSFAIFFSSTASASASASAPHHSFTISSLFHYCIPPSASALRDLPPWLHVNISHLQIIFYRICPSLGWLVLGLCAA